MQYLCLLYVCDHIGIGVMGLQARYRFLFVKNCVGILGVFKFNFKICFCCVWEIICDIGHEVNRVNDYYFMRV